MSETIKTVQMYKTSDGKTFESKQKAIEHQEHLDRPKVYLVENTSGSSGIYTEKAFLNKEKAEKFKKELEKNITILIYTSI